MKIFTYVHFRYTLFSVKYENKDFQVSLFHKNNKKQKEKKTVKLRCMNFNAKNAKDSFNQRLLSFSTWKETLYVTDNKNRADFWARAITDWINISDDRKYEKILSGLRGSERGSYERHLERLAQPLRETLDSVK